MRHRCTESLLLGCPWRASVLFEVVNDHLGAKPFASFHKLQVLRMVVISILRLLGLKLNVQSDLITLIDDTAMALRHPADVKTNNDRNGRKVFLCVSDNLIRCVGVGGIGPKNYDVRKHSSFYGCFRRPGQPGNTLR
jgi:hypothetical protein